MFNRIAIIASKVSGKSLQTKRGLGLADVEIFVNLVRANPHKTVRVYSSMGFLPNSYKWRASIERITRDGKTGHISIDWGGAQRAQGCGATRTINNREAS